MYKALKVRRGTKGELGSINIWKHTCRYINNEEAIKASRQVQHYNTMGGSRKVEKRVGGGRTRRPPSWLGTSISTRVKVKHQLKKRRKWITTRHTQSKQTKSFGISRCKINKTLYTTCTIGEARLYRQHNDMSLIKSTSRADFNIYWE